jgi:hypothetical protein
MGLSGGPRGSYRRRLRRKYRALRRSHASGQWPITGSRPEARTRPEAGQVPAGQWRTAPRQRPEARRWDAPVSHRPAGRRAARSRHSTGRRELPLRGITLPAIIAAGVSALILGVAAVGAHQYVAAGNLADTTAVPNPNCTLIVPADPLSAQGLATPYQLTATDPANGPCNEANNVQTAFVQGAVLDPATGAISVYDPLVVDAGTQPASPPVVPALPAGAVVAVWFGFNGNILSLQGADQASGTQPAGTPSTSGASAVPGGSASATTTTPAGTATSAAPSTSASAGSQTSASQSASATPSVPASPSLSLAAYAAPGAGTAATATPDPANGPAASGTPDAILQQANCVAGQDIDGQFTSFSQVGACNAVAFFQAANTAINAGKLNVPSPGTAKDGLPCLTTRSFALIDQDQSDNVTTEYLANGNGQTAQDTAANQQALGGATTLFNGSDNGLLDFFMDPALGCSPWTAPDLANGGAPATSLPLDELQAAQYAGKVVGFGPAALVPENDPMTLDGNGNFSQDKTNTYRSIMDQSALPAGQSPSAYCSDMEIIQGKRLQQDVNLLIGAPSPAPGTGDNLFTFVSSRLQASFMNLNCGNFGLTNDVSTTVDGNGVVVAACFLNQVAAITPGAGNPTKGMTTCPATTATASATPTPATSSMAASPTPSATTSPTSSAASPTQQPTATQPASTSPAGTGTQPTATTPAQGSQPTPSMTQAQAGQPTQPAATTQPGQQTQPAQQPTATGQAPTTQPVPSGKPTAVWPWATPTRVQPSPATSARGWHDSGWSYTSRGDAWPGLGQDWARPNPRRQWLSAAFGGLWSGILRVF